MEQCHYNSAQFFDLRLLHHKFFYTQFFLNVGISDQEAGVMSLNFTFESTETQYMYVLGSNFRDTQHITFMILCFIFRFLYFAMFLLHCFLAS